MAGRRSYRSKTVDSAVTEQSSISATQKQRSKNFTDAENKVLLSACDKFHEVINKNSSRAVDKAAKVKAWQSIQRGHTNYCKTQGIFVSVSNKIEQNCLLHCFC